MNELDKMQKAREKADTLTDFVDWLREEGIMLCKERVLTELRPKGEDMLCGIRKKDCIIEHKDIAPITENYESLFARFFGINQKKLEEERRTLLDDLRAKQDIKT